MKKNTLAHLLLLTSVALFTACSTKTPKPEIKKEKVTVFDIMGVNVSSPASITAPSASVQVSSSLPLPLPLAQTYPLEIQPTISACETTYEPLYTQFNPMEETIAYDSSLQVYSSATFSEVYESNIIEGEPIPEFTVTTPRPGCKPYVSRYTHVNDVESSAKQLLGIKYVWGATGPYKYDCSGFTQKIYRDAGINIPRVSRDQAKVGKYISYNNLIKGDMVFFDTHKKKTGKVTHVGIYLGNGNFIHASSAAKKIVIVNFNKKKFYKKRFLWGRRVIQDRGHLASL